MTKTRKYLIAFALFVLPITAACMQLSAEDKASVARDAVKLSVCNAQAHLCKLADGGPAACWQEYDDCIARTGLKDGGR